MNFPSCGNTIALGNNVTNHSDAGFVSAKVFRINVGFVMSESIGFVREFEISVPSRVKVSDDVILQHLYATLILSRTREGVLLRGKVETSVPDICSRCTDDVWIPIEFEIEELFAKTAIPELPYFIDDAGNIDLAPLIREEALLNAPMTTPTDDHKRCIFCNRTWQDVLVDNGLAEDDIDPRFEVLLKLRQQMEDENE